MDPLISPNTGFKRRLGSKGQVIDHISAKPEETRRKVNVNSTHHHPYGTDVSPQQLKNKSTNSGHKTTTSKNDQIGHNGGRGSSATHRRGAWLPWEDEALWAAVTENKKREGLIGDEKIEWRKVAMSVPNRTHKQCRERWRYTLSPQVNRGPWSKEEDETILRLQQSIGNKWTEIAKECNGRTENCVKGRWKAMMRAKARYWSPEEDALLKELTEKYKGKDRWNKIATHFPTRKRNACFVRFKKLSNPAGIQPVEDGSPMQVFSRRLGEPAIGTVDNVLSTKSSKANKSFLPPIPKYNKPVSQVKQKGRAPLTSPMVVTRRLGEPLNSFSPGLSKKQQQQRAPRAFFPSNTEQQDNAQSGALETMNTLFFAELATEANGMNFSQNKNMMSPYASFAPVNISYANNEGSGQAIIPPSTIENNLYNPGIGTLQTFPNNSGNVHRNTFTDSADNRIPHQFLDEKGQQENQETKWNTMDTVMSHDDIEALEMQELDLVDYESLLSDLH